MAGWPNMPFEHHGDRAGGRLIARRGKFATGRLKQLFLEPCWLGAVAGWFINVNANISHLQFRNNRQAIVRIAREENQGFSAGSANHCSLPTTTLFFGWRTKFGDMIWTP